MPALQKDRLGLRWIWYAAVLVATVIIDQLTKFLVVRYLKPIRSYPLWQDVFHFTYLENRGAAFGILQDNRWVFLVLSVLAIVAIGCYLYKEPQTDALTAVSLLLIAGGGIGNMIDRVRLGYVVDFLDFTLIDFAIFNAADSFVCVGAGLLVIAFVRIELAEKKKREQEKQGEKTDG